MAYENKLETVTMLSGADYSAGTDQYKFVGVSAANTVTVSSAAGADAFGVIQDTPASGAASTIGIGGMSKVMAGDAVAAGVKVSTDASGRAILATTGHNVMGTSVTAASAAGEIIVVKLDKSGTAA